MAYDSQRGGERSYGQQAYGYNNKNSGQRNSWNDHTNMQYSEPKPIEPKKLPSDYVGEAERVMNELKAAGKYQKFDITTSKIRAIHTLVTDIYKAENLRTETELLEKSQLKLMRLRVRIVYDAGREQAVRTFVEKAQLLAYIKGIENSRTEMIRFAHYMEALVAYHRFLGGREN